MIITRKSKDIYMFLFTVGRLSIKLSLFSTKLWNPHDWGFVFRDRGWLIGCECPAFEIGVWLSK